MIAYAVDINHPNRAGRAMDSGTTTAQPADDAEVPRYKRVKCHVLARIATGDLQPGDRVPSEHELVAELGVSRMTANRALRELTAEGQLTRKAGVGTFVATPKPWGTVLEIRNIADEVRARGGRHSCDVLLLTEEPADEGLAAGFDLPLASPLYHTLILHREDGRPLQVEERWTLPAVAPGFLSLDFTRITPSEHLLTHAPVREVEHLVEAVMPPQPLRDLLAMQPGEPALLLHRRTWVTGAEGVGTRVASLADLWYPGPRYRLGGRFRPV